MIPQSLQFWFKQPRHLATLACGILLWLCRPPASPWLWDLLCSGFLLDISLWAIQFSVRHYPTRVGAVMCGMLVAALSAIAAWWLAGTFLQFHYRGDELTQRWLYQSNYPRLVFALLCAFLIAINAAQNKLRRDLEHTLSKSDEAATLLRQATLYKLRQQLQPHFLYNSLNSISALIILQPDKAQEMTARLASFLRATVKGEDGELAPLHEEMVCIEDYLAIEAIRFGDRLQVLIEAEGAGNAILPPMLLQPIIENAIRFGLYGKTGAVAISLQLVLEQNMLHITVTNPYDPVMRPPSGTGFGLESVRQRLLLIYGRADLLETRSDDTEFITIIRIPQTGTHAIRNSN